MHHNQFQYYKMQTHHTETQRCRSPETQYTRACYNISIFFCNFSTHGRLWTDPCACHLPSATPSPHPPSQSDNITTPTQEDGSSVKGVEDEVLTDNQDNHVDPEEDARTSPFAGLCVAQSAAALWGRRIVSATTSDSAAFAVSELGEV